MQIKKEILVQGDRRLAQLFFPVLQKGVLIELSVSATLQEILVNQLKIEPSYVDSEIQTIFINSKAIDDPERAVINDGDVLALSGPMPGLVGATLRKGGKYAAMRREISGSPTIVASVAHVPGRICLKLFNTVLEDIGAAILAGGVVVSGADLMEAFLRDRQLFEQAKTTLRLNGVDKSLELILDALEDKKYFRIKILGG